MLKLNSKYIVSDNILTWNPCLTSLNQEEDTINVHLSRDDSNLNYPIGCRANMAHISQSRLDSALGFQVEVLKTFKGVLSSRGSGPKTNFFFFSLYYSQAWG